MTWILRDSRENAQHELMLSADLVIQAFSSSSASWCKHWVQSNEKQLTDLGLSGLQLAQLQASK